MSAYGTDLGELVRLPVSRSLRLVYALNLRDDLARFVDDQRVTDTYLHLVDEVLVMKRRAGHGSAAQTYRFEDRDGSYSSRSSRVYFDLEKLRLLLFRRVLICDRPARELDRIAEPSSRRDIVKLNDRAVDIICKVSPRISDLLYRIPDLICSLALKVHVDRSYAVTAQELVAFAVSLEFLSARLLDIEDKKRQMAVAGYARIKLS